MAISMLKIRRPLGRLIFNMGIAIPGKTVFLIGTAPRRWTIASNHSKHRYISMLIAGQDMAAYFTQGNAIIMDELGLHNSQFENGD